MNPSSGGMPCSDTANRTPQSLAYLGNLSAAQASPVLFFGLSDRGFPGLFRVPVGLPVSSHPTRERGVAGEVGRRRSSRPG